MNSLHPTRLCKLLLLVLLFPGAVWADAMTYHGSICEIEGRDDQGYIARNYVGAFNKHYLQTDRNIICPVVRKSPYTTNGLRTVEVRVRRGPYTRSGQVVSCKVVARDMSGRAVHTTSERSGSTAKLSQINFSVPVTAYMGGVEVRCRLPYDTGVAGYEVDEY